MIRTVGYMYAVLVEYVWSYTVAIGGWMILDHIYIRQHRKHFKRALTSVLLQQCSNSSRSRVMSCHDSHVDSQAAFYCISGKPESVRSSDAHATLQVGASAFLRQNAARAVFWPTFGAYFPWQVGFWRCRRFWQASFGLFFWQEGGQMRVGAEVRGAKCVSGQRVHVVKVHRALQLGVQQ
jgi:hypothetical protein